MTLFITTRDNAHNVIPELIQGDQTAAVVLETAPQVMADKVAEISHVDVEDVEDHHIVDIIVLQKLQFAINVTDEVIGPVYAMEQKLFTLFMNKTLMKKCMTMRIVLS